MAFWTKAHTVDAEFIIEDNAQQVADKLNALFGENAYCADDLVGYWVVIDGGTVSVLDDDTFDKRYVNDEDEDLDATIYDDGDDEDEDDEDLDGDEDDDSEDDEDDDEEHDFCDDIDELVDIIDEMLVAEQRVNDVKLGMRLATALPLDKKGCSFGSLHNIPSIKWSDLCYHGKGHGKHKDDTGHGRGHGSKCCGCGLCDSDADDGFDGEDDTKEEDAGFEKSDSCSDGCTACCGCAESTEDDASDYAEDD